MRSKERVTNSVVDMIKYAYNPPDGRKAFVDFFIFSPELMKGVGKTSFALRVMYRVYGDWDEALNKLYMKPEDAIQLLVDLVKKRKRIPVFAMDDVGMWLSGLTFSMSKGKQRQAITSFYEFYNAIRTVSASCLFTAPKNDMLRTLLDQVNFRIAISPYSEEMSLAKIYKVKATPMFQKFIKTHHQEVFPIRLPDEIYRKYEEKRWDALEWKANELVKVWSDAKEDVLEERMPNIVKEVYIPTTQSVNPLDIYKNYRMGSHDTYADSVTFPKALSKKYGLHKGDTFVWIDVGFPIGVPDIYFEEFIQTFFKKKEEDGDADMDSSS
ncbi:hypothetical protein [Archaeoglobus profundus]|uniref:Zona occludens toxin N-terminal domain-containing protein n=1 Tax=Archaeoglobus profundus (strain DSM 5631 / JCM 9629 / NBRC 100127 / Av18) TaxID=572546 RepID=D2RF25_ARCPA|nr:hypothetical protein [Archaeoglobus profundus]ADB58719.1 hypothetical protein Arcpr_1673 [Archaeoglobus profundus DSM 5631]